MIASSPIRYRVLRWAATHAVAAALLTVTLAVVFAAVLVTAAGARRTGSAADRYQKKFGGGHDLIVNQDENDPLTAEVAALSSVSNAESMTFMFAGSEELDAIAFSGTIAAAESRVVEGRLPDPATFDEFVATASTLERGGIEIGDSIEMMSLTPEDVEAHGFDVRFASGPQWTATLVGLIEGPGELSDSTPLMVFSPAMLADGRIGHATTIMAVTLADGATEPEFRQQLDGLGIENAFSVFPATTVDADLRTALRGQSLGLWLLAAAGGIAAIVAMGHLLGRNVRLTSDERTSLSAIGATPTQLVAESAARGAIVVAGATVVAVGLAIAASGVFPFGFARAVEPTPGLRIEPWVLLAGAGALAVGIVAWVAVLAAAPTATRLARPGAIGAIADRSPWPSLSTGLRFAFTRRAGGSVSLLATLGGTILTVAAIIGTLTFGLSLDRLIDEPERYGENFDYVIDHGSEEVPADMLAMVMNHPSIADVEGYRTALARVDDTTVPIFAGQHLRGDIDPVLLDGRLPAGDDEIALGAVSAGELDVGIGDTLRLTSAEGTADFDVVGFVILPGIRGYDRLGYGAYADTTAFDLLFPDVPMQSAAVRLVPGASVDAERARIAEQLGVAIEQTDLTPPSTILNLSRVTFVPFALAALLLALGSIGAVGSLWTAVRRREHQIAVLRALGADRRWLTRAGAWHAVVFTIVPAAAGAVLGVIVGRLAFSDFATDRGVVDSVAVPWLLGLASIAVLIVLAVASATLAGYRARNREPALLLRAG